MVEVRVKDFIASRLEAASFLFAQQATEIERSHPQARAEFSADAIGPHNRVMEYTAGAVVMAVAAVESAANEILSAEPDLKSPDAIPSGTAMRHVTNEAQRRWQRMWRREVPGQGFNALEKCQIALDLADIPPLPETHGSVQDMAILIRLRNELVHSEPVFRRHGIDLPQKDLDRLERTVRGKFEPCTMVANTTPFIWQRCLGAGCAQWAVMPRAALINDFFAALGIPIRREPRFTHSFTSRSP